MAPTEDAIKLLGELAEVRAALALTRSDYEAKRRAILAAVQADLDALDAEYAPALEVGDQREELLTKAAKAAVAAAGETVKAAGLTARFTRGRESWDHAALQGYIAAGHPELLAFQKIGEPSVAILADKKK